MSRIFIATPARPGSRTGNLHTAQRWAAMLRAAGHRVAIGTEWRGQACEVLIALHAKRSHPSVLAWRKAHPSGGLVVALTGTDLYRDLPRSAEAGRSLDLADRIITLQDDAPRKLAAALRRKTSVVYQSSDTTLRPSPPRDRFRIAVVGHLRAEKDPFRAAYALKTVTHAGLELVQIGGALDRPHGKEARRLGAADPRYRWVGSVTHAQALRWIARSHVLVVSSRMEGGANVIAEAARIGTPVLASRMSGNLGMLGRAYPGFFRTGDEDSLARLIVKTMDPRFREVLRKAVAGRRARFAPAAEKRALRRAISAARRRSSATPRRTSRARRS